MIMCRALSYEENTLDKSRLRSVFLKPMRSRTAFPICNGTQMTVILGRTSKDPVFKPCLRKSKRDEWQSVLPKTYPDWDEIPR